MSITEANRDKGERPEYGVNPIPVLPHATPSNGGGGVLGLSGRGEDGLGFRVYGLGLMVDGLCSGDSPGGLGGSSG